MAQLVFSLLLIGQIFFFYKQIMDYQLKNQKKGFWFKIILLIIFIIILAVISYYGIRQLGLVILISLSIPLLLECDLKIAYGLFFPIVGVCLSSNTIWNFFIYDKGNSIARDQKRIICLLLTYLFLYIISLVKKYRRIDMKCIMFSGNDIIVFNVLTLFIGIALAGIDILQKGRESTKTFNIYISITTVLCIILYILSIYLIFLNIKMLDEHNKNIYQQITLESQKEQINAVLESEERLHSYRHDLNAHLNALYFMALKEDISGIQEYCEKLLEYSQGFKHVTISGNTAVDGILGREIEKSKEKGINLQMQVKLLRKNKISDYELCIVFSNILDNAIEACKRGDVIKLACYPYNDYLCIISENPFRNSDVIDFENEIETTKEDKIRHGHGIKNIRAVVEKYDGVMNINCKCGRFTVEILM